jgi:Outer membrane lipoprotein-sorting protein
MSRSTLSIPGILFGLALCSLPLNAVAALSAADIVKKSTEIEGGDDSISRLSFTFNKPDGQQRKLIYTMVWKEYAGRDDVDDKVIFFSEYPPDDKGKSFMIWVYDNKKDDEWMYLPELRMVRKVTHSEHHGHHDEEDEFAHSVLTQVDLVPRKPDLDTHTRLKDEEVDGHSDFVVESVPKRADNNYPYQKTRRWITQDNFLPERTDYYGPSGALIKRQTIKWKKIGNAWVWEQVVGEDLITGKRTLLDISDIKLNNGLKDEVFSARTMRLGKDSIVQ